MNLEVKLNKWPQTSDSLSFNFLYEYAPSDKFLNPVYYEEGAMMPKTLLFSDKNTLSKLGRVKFESLTPCQVATSPKLMRSADVYQQRCIKHPCLSIFHSYEEFLYALLLEADHAVKNYVPQPFKLKINGQLYTPDFYVSYTSGFECIKELKPEGKMDENLRSLLVEFFSYHDMRFEVVDNDNIMKREKTALNWLPIIQVLAASDEAGLDCQTQELQLWQKCLSLNDDPIVRDLINPELKNHNEVMQIALCKLIHKHRLIADLDDKPLDYNTVLKRCEYPGVVGS